ncbi:MULTISPECIES: ABC transporter substrate-binding protein [unclassified Streptomyces]|uniref:ABC transporter substrate-binding protein n=1 Tax=unclassified Streptomyces TaxID=2593676 RepID=UPI00093DEE27|nr:ABC transporter substrate-binding protein [Streptomyces sp. CB02058]OKI97983.1 sugar ABC transporter substrate-binding protein [Streptomyces sp. CB02058]
MGRTRARRTAVALLAATALVTLAACGSGTDTADGKITLTVATFSDFGYKPLIKEYERTHPDIEIKERISQFDQHHNQLSTQIASGSGAADVVAIEEGYLPKFRSVKDKFTNLADHGAMNRKSEYLDWKWQQGTLGTPDFVMGYGTDVGSLAICYRKDLFEKAGLPTERTEVGKLWPTWEDYFATGEKFQDKVKDKAWFDSSGNIFTAMMNQTEFGFFDADDQYIGDKNPKVREFFMATAEATADKQSANLQPFSQQWNAGIKLGRMATMTCPAWMTGQIAVAAGEANAGKWDIAAVPGGGGNWGGSFLAVPKQSKHAKEAAELADFLTSAASQKKIFTGPVGALPSLVSVFEDPEVKGATSDYFSDAPTGEIYASSAKSLKPNYRGSKDQQARIPFGNALQLVEQDKADPEEAWEKSLDEAAKNLR